LNKLKIKYIDIGTGNRIGSTIYLNKKLKKHPSLHDAILKHEKNHSGGFSSKDFLMDVSNKELQGFKREYYTFVLNNPSSWCNFLPVMKINGVWTYDVSVLTIWVFAVLVGVLMWILI